MKSENEIRDKIDKYGKCAEELYDHEYQEAMSVIHILRWVLNDERDATGEDEDTPTPHTS